MQQWKYWFIRKLSPVLKFQLTSTISRHCSHPVQSCSFAALTLFNWCQKTLAQQHPRFMGAEFCYPDMSDPAGSGSMPDPDMSDPAAYARSRCKPDPSHMDPTGSGSSWIRIQNLDYCRQHENNYFFCTTTGKAGMTVYPILWPNFYLSD